jgi:hypothetical protein
MVLKSSLYNMNVGDVAGRMARRKIDRLCSDSEAGGRDGKAER